MSSTDPAESTSDTRGDDQEDTMTDDSRTWAEDTTGATDSTPTGSRTTTGPGTSDEPATTYGPGTRYGPGTTDGPGTTCEPAPAPEAPTGPAVGTLVWGCVVLAVAALLGAWELAGLRLDLSLVVPVGMVVLGLLLVVGAVATAVRSNRG